MDNKDLNLFKALGLFIHEIREQFHGMCLREFGMEWPNKYSETFRYTDKREIWDKNIENGEKPEDLIDFGDLEMFSEKNRESKFFRKKFKGNNRKIGTYFKDIAEVRNRLMHFQSIDKNKVLKSYLHMIDIAKILGLKKLENQLNELMEASYGPEDGGVSSTSERLYTNTEIQEKITEVAKDLEMDELKKLCEKEYSKKTFNRKNRFPVFTRISENSSIEERRLARKDDKGYNRWTDKYQFKRNGYIYYVSTQWYDYNDEYVKRWLNSKHSRI